MFAGANIIDLRSPDIDPNYTEIDWLNGVPSEIRKYADDSKSLLVTTVTPTWSNGVPIEVESVNHKTGAITTTTLNWVDGVPDIVTKVIT